MISRAESLWMGYKEKDRVQEIMNQTKTAEPKVRSSVQRGHMLESPCIPYAARYGVGTISRKDPVSSKDDAAVSSET